jgi:hypothetical protein
MLVAPPGSLKTSVIDLLAGLTGVRIISDLNVQTLNRMYDSFVCGEIRTLAFKDLQKIYQRHDSTASNIEGHLAGYVTDGFSLASYEDQRIVTRAAHCLVIAGLTTTLHRRKFAEWMESGFYRRFLWCHFWMDATNLPLVSSVCDKQPLRIADESSLACLFPRGPISYSLVSTEETHVMGDWLAHYGDQGSAPLALLQKMICVLRWKYPTEKYGDKAWRIMEDFSECLKPGDGGDLELPQQTKPPVFISRTGEPIVPSEEAIAEFRKKVQERPDPFRNGEYHPLEVPTFISSKGTPIKPKRNEERKDA